jgi:endonuclease-3
MKARAPPRAGAILARLEDTYGRPRAGAPRDPYLFLIWWQCGYPPSEERCTRGWQALQAAVDLSPRALRAARSGQLVRALKAGGLVPQLRATRIRAIARTLEEEFGGDLTAALKQRPVAEARRLLKRFPGIGAPGADRILLFAGLAPAAAVPSSCPHVLVRVLDGTESAKYATTYARARALIEQQVPATLAARRHAYLLLQRHGRERCKARKPQCEICSLAGECAWLARRVPRRRID